MITFIDLIPSWAIVLVWFISMVVVVVDTYHKCKDETVSYQSLAKWFIAFVFIIGFSVLFGMKCVREVWTEDVIRLNKEFEMKMLETNKVNTDIVEQEKERVVVRTEQKIKVLTKIEKIESDNFKDYYDVLNEASRRP